MVDGAEPRHSAFEVCDEEASEDKDQKIQIKLGRRNEMRQREPTSTNAIHVRPRRETLWGAVPPPPSKEEE